MNKLCECLVAVVLGLTVVPAMAQEQTESKPTAAEKGWFAGVQAGVPFGVSTFSSFGADKTRAGYSAGLFGGYRFSPVLSLEASAKWGGLNFSARDCCAGRGYWLGADCVRYNAPVLDMEGWDYSNLKSDVFMQYYGLQLNVNVLGFFNATRQSRWTLEVSPLLAAVGTKATVKAISDGAEVSRGDTRWHLGVGGNLQAGYQVTKHLNIGIYSGLAYLTGKRMDGVIEHLHKANYVWESGIRIGIKFGKGRKSGQSSAPAVVTPVVVETPTQEPEVTVCPEETAPATELRETPKEAVEPAGPPATGPEAPESEWPVIYFAFNSTRIRYSELPKIHAIRDFMRENPEVKMTVEGWCDARGEAEYNRVFSEWRADAVKRCLVSYGIAADRIAVKGMGVDTAAADDAGARRAECVTIETK